MPKTLCDASYIKKTHGHSTCPTEGQVPVLELSENICKKRKRTTSCKEHTQDTNGKFITTTLKKNYKPERFKLKNSVPPMEARPKNIIRIKIATPKKTSTSTAALREDISTDTTTQTPNWTALTARQ